MKELIIYCLFFGILSTCLGSPIFWYNLIRCHTIWGDKKRLGISKNMKFGNFIKFQAEVFVFTISATFLVYHFKGFALFALGSFVALACIGLSHIWSSAFYTRLEEKNFLWFKTKLIIFFSLLIVYIFLWAL